MVPATAAEDEANKKRWEESGGSQGSTDQWRWTLNWDQITDDIVVGSCPRSPSDVDRIQEESGCDAIMCLQCELCHDALQIDWPVLRERAVERGMLITRVAVRDFDHNDQALMLPEAVRTLHLLLAMGRRVYVHCTAGINRATLTVVGYLTFVQGMPLDPAVELVKRRRPQAHPYIDCWRTVRARLVEGRREEVKATARRLAEERPEGGDSMDNWINAEELLIKEQFERQMRASLSLITSMQDVHASQSGAAASAPSATVQPVQQHSLAVGGDVAVELVADEEQVDRAESELLDGCVVDGADVELLNGCVLALEIAQEATSEAEELKWAMADLARLTEDALLSTPGSELAVSMLAFEAGGQHGMLDYEAGDEDGMLDFEAEGDDGMLTDKPGAEESVVPLNGAHNGALQ